MPKKTFQSQWSRDCPNCDNIQYYSSKRNLKRAIDNNKNCNECRRHSKEQKAHLSRIMTGRSHPHKTPDHKQKKNFFRICPACKKRLGYVSKFARDRSEKGNCICNSCSAIVYEKTWNNIINEDHIKQMRATKAGFKNWEEYERLYPEKKKYKAEVRRITYQQPLETLEHFDKRGRCGVEGSHQIDHIISITEGYEKQMPPEVIGDISNLQMLPWKENLSKSNY